MRSTILTDIQKRVASFVCERNLNKELHWFICDSFRVDRQEMTAVTCGRETLMCWPLFLRVGRFKPVLGITYVVGVHFFNYYKYARHIHIWTSFSLL